jgi:hypothetical protein
MSTGGSHRAAAASASQLPDLPPLESWVHAAVDLATRRIETTAVDSAPTLEAWAEGLGRLGLAVDPALLACGPTASPRWCSTSMRRMHGWTYLGQQVS